MKKQKMLKRAAAAVSGIIVFSGTTSMTTAEEAVTEKTSVAAAEVSSAADAVTEAASELTADTAEEMQKMPEDWEKADISQYDSSLTLISYELATPEMAKIGEAPDPYAGLSEEERKAREEAAEKKKSALKKGTPTLSKNAAKSRSKTPTAVEAKTSGAFVGDIPDSQPGPVIDAQPGQFAFVTYGWGHGVGMSQNGANFYAAYAGWTYQDILFHYYPGTYLMNTGMTDEEELTIAHEPAGDTLKVVSEIVNREVGGSFSYEAIKAQAVAVYTYLKYNGDDSRDLRGKPNPPQVVIDACNEVLGEALYYDGNYALTVFSASSGGCSANCYEVFYADYPYLRSVPSEYDAAFDPHWGTVKYMDAAEVKKKLEAGYHITLSDDPNNWIQPVYSDETGYVTEVSIDGQVTAKGYPFSMLLGLKSSKFNLTYKND
ncbi:MULTISPECIES: SpoIID/LytB domain-containing protein [Ruminococcus]|uniref:SpoIID/LytB domain protein n=2 Tax=Ruminococcus TaxID=1263 RepID=A0A1M7J809_RUMFL|nr:MULTISPECIES: SpoIID/LytB domain-containing protein [Ruminococcus]MCR4793831.1 sporulation protein [Ruminococcus sp.]SHM49159.1 SpoIID/LytB domain protein [Ruminococcus flavefaciens]